ncbi:hypothetical protein N806_29705 [Rhodococcus sp. P27]|nr:hypothetical protein N806_29705 [Rhodococcus sp. P27]
MFEALETKGTRFLRGQLVLVAAGPGTGKSAFVLTMALKARVPTLYFSADSDAFTQLTRSLSIMTGWSLDQSAKAVLTGELGEAEEAFNGIPIRFNYNASPSLDNIETSMRSYEEVYGDFPSLVVIDNVTNVRSGGDGDDDPFAGLESLMDYLHDMGRATGACVIGLHHVTGAYNDADKAIPLSGVKGQITRVPEMVLTLHRQTSDLDFGSDTLFVSTVKNRGGKSDPSGVDAAELEFIGDRMTIRDFAYNT